MPDQQGGRPAGERLVLRTAIGQYPHTAALRDGAVTSDLVAFDFADVPTIHQAFAPMVREQRFDVSEIAIATFLQAKAYRTAARPPARGAGRALPAIGPAVPDGRRHP